MNNLCGVHNPPTPVGVNLARFKKRHGRDLHFGAHVLAFLGGADGTSRVSLATPGAKTSLHCARELPPMAHAASGALHITFMRQQHGASSGSFLDCVRRQPVGTADVIHDALRAVVAVEVPMVLVMHPVVVADPVARVHSTGVEHEKLE